MNKYVKHFIYKSIIKILIIQLLLKKNVKMFQIYSQNLSRSEKKVNVLFEILQRNCNKI